MPFEYTPPKYARVVAELQRRIESGAYPPGALLPSEAQLTEEFAVARPTVVRALQVLQQDGWIDSQQGKGRFVRGRPALEQLASGPRTAVEAISLPPEGTSETILSVEYETPPTRLRGLLGLSGEDTALHRLVLHSHDGQPLELVSIWAPGLLVAGTDLETAEPLRESLRHHLESKRGVRFDHALEQITARRPIPEETEHLAIPDGVPVLVVHASLRGPDSQPLVALSVVLPADRHELDDAYSLEE